MKNLNRSFVSSYIMTKTIFGKKLLLIATITVLVTGLTLAATFNDAEATTTCTFTKDFVKKVMKLDADCTTDETIKIPDGWTLDGKKKTITAEDPMVGTFVGGVIENAGTTAHVKNLKITTDSLANSCKAGPERLRGIFFDGASGTITKNEVMNINKGASGCQEGNAIEVRNAPFDGTHPDTQTVTISKNKLTNWQKTGIVANGDVNVVIKKNKIGESATQFNLAANSIQLGFGAIGVIEKNKIDGNQWCGGTSNFAASAILLFSSTDGAKIDKNKIGGNSDIGIFLVADKVTVSKNKITDKNPDCANSTFDTGIGDFGVDNILVKNKIKGFDTPIGSEYAHNPYPQPQNP